MQNSLIKKGLVIGIIILFVGVAFAPSLQANIGEEYNDVTTEFLRIGKKHTIQRTRQEAEELENLFSTNRENIFYTQTGKDIKSSITKATENVKEPMVPHFFRDIIVFIANQGWISRIYLLDMAGQVVTYYEYEFYIFSDVEVVNNELYVVDWVAPRLYKVDLHTGDLDVIVDDWNLIYMYDVAYDGTYFYIDEWDLNRYDINGNYQGTASFDQSIRGSAWDGSFYWTLTTDNQIKCWDISNWPMITEISENMFNPPTSDCSGLWFDGTYFWTAESIDGSLGYIYQFNYDGGVISQWLEPAYMGYAACVITDFLPNNPPNKPSIDGPTSGNAGEEYCWTFHSTDPDGDDVYFYIDWGDDTNTGWIGPYSSCTSVEVDHTYDEIGNYTIGAKAKDIFDAESDWGYLEVTMPISFNSSSFLQFLERPFERFPRASPIFRNILRL